MTEHYYQPGYGLLFDATWYYVDLWQTRTNDDTWRLCSSEAYDEWHCFATYPKLKVEEFHTDYGGSPGHRLIMNFNREACYMIARLDWHWTDDEVTK
jgi:hypothetical protein